MVWIKRRKATLHKHKHISPVTGLILGSVRMIVDRSHTKHRFTEFLGGWACYNSSITRTLAWFFYY